MILGCLILTVIKQIWRYIYMPLYIRILVLECREATGTV